MSTRPLRKDAERNRRRILDAADAVFAAEGLNATLEGIAEKADVSIGTLYRRFPTREALVEALFEEKVERISGWAAEALQNPDPWEGFIGYLWQTAGSHAADQGLSEVMAGSTLAQEKITELRSRIAPVVTEVVERAKAGGRLRPDFAPQDVAMIMVMVRSAAQKAPGAWRRYLELLLAGAQSREPLTVEPPSFDQVSPPFNRC
jgi:AcrR family transcriptional regulator